MTQQSPPNETMRKEAARALEVAGEQIALALRESQPQIDALGETLQRLALALNDALEALGARGMTVALNPLGGVEAWQGAPQVLVIGVGALTVFGQSELTYLAALALALGEGGHKLAEPGDVEGFADAAVRAFDA